MLDQMVLAYDRGLLAPLIGAGMSCPQCPLWASFVEKMESAANIGRGESGRDLTQRSAHAVRKLRFGGGMRLAEAVADALSQAPSAPPPQTERLAQISWPLVLTTNYDDHYVAAAFNTYLKSVQGANLSKEEKRAVPVLLLGRAEPDCQRVLTSLRQPDAPILWALQGFVGGQSLVHHHTGSLCALADLHDNLFDRAADALGQELVVGHAEYRRVAAAAPHFRRAFSEVFRSRSLLFLGSGLNDKYFLDLFSEIIELYGPSPYPHFAVMEKDTSDISFLRDYFGIRVQEIDRYDELPDWLNGLNRRINDRRVRRLNWTFGLRDAAAPNPSFGCEELRIVRGRVPDDVPDDECVAFSAGGSSGQPQISSVGLEILDRHHLDPEGFRREADQNPAFVWVHSRDRRFFGVNARLDPWTLSGAEIRPTDPLKWPINPLADRCGAGGRARRDLRLIPRAVEELMSAAQRCNKTRVHAVLLASGKLRTFPQSYGLCQMVRGWARWRESCRPPAPSLSIYVTAPEVLHNLDAERFDFAAYLCPDRIDFWIEIVKREGGLERYLHTASALEPLRRVLTEFAIESRDWRLGLMPKPCLDWANWTVAGVHDWEKKYGRDLTAECFGILPGSTLRLAAPDTDRALFDGVAGR